jgi:hypothetical protein
MTHFGLSRRTRTFLLWSARLAFLAYFVQISAMDHWHTHITDVLGVQDTSAHVQHCHGAGDCSTSDVSTISANAELETRLIQPAAYFRIETVAQLTPEAAFISPPSEPPRAV